MEINRLWAKLNIKMKQSGTLGKKKPLVICHRGYCSMFPQNTLESIQAGLYKSQLVEFDIQLTKDHEVVIFHDRYLSQLTNIADLEEYSNRKREAQYDLDQNQTTRNDWWLVDFTLQELQSLKVKQKFKERPQFKNLHFKIPSLEEAIKEVISIKKNRLVNNNCGFLIEIKSLWEDKDDEWDRLLIQKLVGLLKKYGLSTEQNCEEKNFPIVIQSFNHNILLITSKSGLTLPIIHLFDERQNINQSLIKTKWVRNMVGIGISKNHATKEIKELCKINELSVLYWTLRDDQIEDIPFNLKSYKEVYFYLLDVGIDGFITEFPDKFQEYFSLYNSEHQ